MPTPGKPLPGFPELPSPNDGKRRQNTNNGKVARLVTDTCSNLLLPGKILRLMISTHPRAHYYLKNLVTRKFSHDLTSSIEQNKDLVKSDQRNVTATQLFQLVVNCC